MKHPKTFETRPKTFETRPKHPKIFETSKTFETRPKHPKTFETPQNIRKTAKAFKTPETFETPPKHSNGHGQTGTKDDSYGKDGHLWKRRVFVEKTGIKHLKARFFTHTGHNQYYTYNVM